MSARRFDLEVTSPFRLDLTVWALRRRSPGAARLDDLRALGFSPAKARAIEGLADRLASGELDLDGLGHLEDDEVRAALITIPGVGRWSAEYVMLRGLGRLHVLPGDDIGARNSLQRRFELARVGYGELVELALQWWPYGGLVYFHLLLDALAGAGHPLPSPPDPALGPEEVA